MSSNSSMLKSLLLTCPNSNKEEIFDICKIENNKQFAENLIGLYKRELINAENLIECKQPDINLDNNQYFDELVNYICELNEIIDINNLYFRNYELVDTVCKHLDDVINLNLESRPKQPKLQSTKKTRTEVIENLKKNKNMDNIVNALVFEIKNIDYFKQLFQEFIMDFKNYFNDIANVSILVEKYIDIVKSDEFEKYDLISMSKVISYIVNNKELRLSFKDKRDILKTLNRTILKLNNSDYSNRERLEIINSLNILVEDIKNIKPETKQQLKTKLNTKYQIKPEFSYEALKATNNLKKVNNKLYTDLTNKKVITIDYNSTICSEDAFSMETLPNGNYLLGIYITDVYSYIKENSILELEAYNRVKTIYIPRKPLTMFPEELAYNKFCLNENQNKYVIANLFELSPKFDLINHEIKRAIIKTTSNKTYQEIVDELQNPTDIKDRETYQNLLSFNDFIKKTNPILQKHYNKRSYQSKNDGNDSIESMVSNFMIYVNYMSQEVYDKLDLPCIYKIYYMNKYNPDFNKIEKDQSLGDLVLNNLQEPSYKSFYSASKTGHSGSNLCISMPTTVPVRKYAALQNQKLIQKYYIDNITIKDAEVYKLEEQLDIVSNYLNENNKMINEYIEEYRYGIKQYKKK
ncbi:MAG: RNB domain-containing ribonuclease [Bacilli bacterium]|nr:RNB domain-containing ribonuclease [Bacilli bacterium]